ncbi:MAG: hypothetical protein WBK65_06970 [Thermotogota bacterium]
MKKRGLGVLIAVLALVFVISSCVLFKGTPVGKKWKGTVTLTGAAGQVAAGAYNVNITLEFEWLFGNSKIIGGQVTLTPVVTTGERAGAEPYKFNITGGEYAEADTTLSFKAKEVDTKDILDFTGKVVEKAISNGVITFGVLTVGSFAISEQTS